MEKNFLIVAYYSRVLKKDKAFFAARKMKTAIFDEVEERRKNATTDEERKAIDDFDISKRQLASDTYNLLVPQRFRPIPMSFFEEGLDCKINPFYAEELRNMKKEKKEKHKREKQNVEVKVEPKVEIKPEIKQEEKKIVSSVGNVVNNRYNNQNNNNTNNNTTQNINNNVEKKNNDIKIEDYFPNEINSIKKYAYGYMGNEKYKESARIAFIKVDILSQKSIKDKAALTKLSELLKALHNVLDVDTKEARLKLEKMIK